MNVNELITLFRRQSEESAYTYDSDMPDSFSLWSNFQLIQYLNEAQEEFCEKTRILKDNTNFSFVTVSGISEYSSYPEVLSIERAENITDNTLLKPITIEEFETSISINDYGFSRPASWLTNTGTPRYIITDLDTEYYRLYPIPDNTYTINLAVRRLPLVRLTSLLDELEVPERYQYGLLYKMQAEAYTAPKAIMAGYGEASVLAERKWQDFLVNSASSIKKKTRNPGKTRYGGL